MTVTRRQALLGAAAGLLTGCDSRRPSSVDVFGVDPQRNLEVVVYNGHFGEAASRAHEARYKKSYPRADIRHSAVQDVSRSLRRRFTEGTPPDVVQNSGPGALALDLVEPADLRPLLDAPSLDVPGRTVGQTLRPGTVEGGAVRYAYTVYGAWVSGPLPGPAPRTWDEHVALCRRLAAAGQVPWSYDERRPYEVSWALLATAVKAGGPTVARALDNLEPNAWRAAALRSAAQAWHQLVRERWIRSGVPGVFRSSGSWVSRSFPGIVPVPGLGSGDALPTTAIRATPEEPFVVPARAANLAGGLEYLRVMLSRAGAGDFATAASSLTAVADGTSGVALRPGLASAMDVLSAAGSETFTFAYPQRYPVLERSVVGPACAEFLAGRLGPDEFLARCQKGADDLARTI
jgi:N-acetylglucosamine transport system substrate-binding protein